MKALSVVALSAALLGGCAASPTHDSAGQYLDDTVITTRIKTELLTSKDVSFTDIGVETVRGGAVQLSGFVRSEAERQRAGEIARSVPGVKQVNNDIRVRESIGEYLDDTAITAQIETELLDGEGIWSSDIIRVETVQGVVHLRGYVTTEHHRQRAGQIAQSIAGVKDVENDLSVR